VKCPAAGVLKISFTLVNVSAEPPVISIFTVVPANTWLPLLVTYAVPVTVTFVRPLIVSTVTSPPRTWTW